MGICDSIHCFGRQLFGDKNEMSDLVENPELDLAESGKMQKKGRLFTAKISTYLPTPTNQEFFLLIKLS